MREMKDSNQKWIGKIPSNWQIAKIDSLYSIRNTKVSDYEYEPLSVTMNGIVHQLENAAKTNAHDDRKLVKKGDFVINSRSDRRGSCGISDYDGSVSLINTALSPKDDMNPGYYNWLFHTVAFSDEFYRWGHGIVDDLWTTTWQDMRKIVVPIPDIKEQQKIANFLDSKCSEIDALMADIQTQIETFEEYKKSVITEAVTKGLDPNVEMKDIGVEWVDKIPTNWEIIPLKHNFWFNKGLSITKEDLIDEGLNVISYGQVHSKDNTGTAISSNLIRFVSEEFSAYTSSKVNKFGFIFADTSEDIEGVGNCCYTEMEEPLFGGYHTIILNSKRNASNKYLAYLFRTDIWRAQLREIVTGIKVYSITQTKLKSTKVIIPPVLEQNHIVSFLDSKCSEINAIIDAKKQQLETIENYKKSLIYEYVTGKKEVIA